MKATKNIIDELEAVIRSGTQQERIDIMRRVTVLFLTGADRFSSDQVGLFDDVLSRLTQQVESRVLAELGGKLAPVRNAPRNVIRTLAQHDEIAVAGPVLSQSPALSDADLVEIARTKGQEHLGAISERKVIGSAVTDILISRGDSNVIHKLSRNRGAAFSDRGLGVLTQRAEKDESLAENLGMRVDLPPQVLRELVARATDVVRTRLLSAAPLETRAAIREVVNAVANEAAQASKTRDFRRAIAAVDDLKKKGLLDEPSLIAFAGERKFEETVVALASMCAAPHALIETLMDNRGHKGLLIACKAAKLYWPTASAILKSKPARPQPAELERAASDFQRLSVPTAQRLIRFWIVRGVAENQDQLSAWAIN